MTTNLRQLMREMTEGYRFKKRMSTNFLQVTGPISCARCDYETDEKLPLNEQERRFRYHLETAHPNRNKEELSRKAINRPIVEIEG